MCKDTFARTIYLASVQRVLPANLNTLRRFLLTRRSVWLNSPTFPRKKTGSIGLSAKKTLIASVVYLLRARCELDVTIAE